MNLTLIERLFSCFLDVFRCVEIRPTQFQTDHVVSLFPQRSGLIGDGPEL